MNFDFRQACVEYYDPFKSLLEEVHIQHEFYKDRTVSRLQKVIVNEKSIYIGGIMNRGHINNYAECLKLKPSQVLVMRTDALFII